MGYGRPATIVCARCRKSSQGRLEWQGADLLLAKLSHDGVCGEARPQSVL